jgi:hypothetical protein
MVFDGRRRWHTHNIIHIKTASKSDKK